MSKEDDFDIDSFDEQEVADVDIEYQEKNEDDDCGESCKI